MGRLAFWVACLACIGGQTLRVQSSVKLANAAQGHDSALLARLFLAKDLIAAFATHNQGVMSTWRLRPRSWRIQNPCPLSMSFVKLELERRVDVDGNGYTQREFQAWYGDLWEHRWNNARLAPAGNLDARQTKGFEACKVGDEVTCEVKSYLRFGVILKFPPNMQGLLHVNDIGTDYIDDASRLRDMFPREDAVKCRILDMDAQSGRIRLATFERRALSDLQIGEEVEGTVKNVMRRLVNLDIGADINAELLMEDIASREVKEQLAMGSKVMCRIEEIPSGNGNKEHIRVSFKDMLEEEVDWEEEEEDMYTDDVPFDIMDAKELRQMGIEYFEDVEGYSPERRKRMFVTESGDLKRKFRGKELSAFRIGEEVDGRVTRIKPFGVFVNIGAEVEALFPRSLVPDKLLESFETERRVTCRVIRIDLPKATISVSCKARSRGVATSHQEFVFQTHATSTIDSNEMSTSSAEKSSDYSAAGLNSESTGQTYSGRIDLLTESYGLIKCDELQERFPGKGVYCGDFSQLAGRTVGESVDFDLALTKAGNPCALNIRSMGDASSTRFSEFSPEQEVRENMRSQHLKRQKPVVLGVPVISEAEVRQAQALKEETVEATEDFDSLKVSDLKERLRAVGLKVSGKKSELVSRLKEHVAA